MTSSHSCASRLSWLLFLAHGAGGCSQGDEIPAAQDENGHTKQPEEAEWTRASDEVCDSRKQTVEQWLEGYRHCERDADCEITEIPGECVPSFLCSRALSSSADRSELADEAARKQAQYEPECGCAIARCVQASDREAYCDSKTKLCEERARKRAPDGDASACSKPLSACIDPSRIDAGRVDAGTADAATSDRTTQDASARGAPTDGGDAGADLFSCRVAADCEIKNVGNCCGYYPRCANKAAVFSPPRCEPGVSGVCGYPEIDACTCRENSCRSLQSGNEI